MEERNRSENIRTALNGNELGAVLRCADGRTSFIINFAIRLFDDILTERGPTTTDAWTTI
jgi:hypothetical protein